jgi:uncharacterized membrane protein
MSKWNDDALDRMVGIVLRTGVVLSAAIVFIGGAMWLSGHVPVQDHRKFQGPAVQYTHFSAILHGAAGLDPLSIVQLGLLLLIATPVVRVIACVAGFAFERDWTYAIISAIVLLMLLISNTA